VLVAFGLTGLLDAAGSATLVLHFRHALRHEVISERHERRALLVVSIGLVVIGVGTAAESARRLAGHVTAEAVPAGLALAIASCLVLSALALRKRVVAARIPSRALLADSWLSATGCLLALVTVAGTGMLEAFGWWWVDPGAAAVVATGAIVAAVVMLRVPG
jgi:divalent metal cation (Fe/Co/Zn/Cd) transporter